MNKREARECLILWTVFNSGITSLNLRGFAIRLLMDFEPEAGGTTVTMTEYSKRIGVSVPTMWKYAHELKASGEWDINLVKGQPTTYKPRFITEALSAPQLP